MRARPLDPTKPLAAIAAGALLAACGPEATRAPVADLILVDARVVTMDSEDTIAEAVALRGNVIAAVGTTADIRRLAGPDTETIELGGNTVTPGLIDTHNHFAWSVSPGGPR